MLRAEANEARNDPVKENAFRQFRLNQWVQQVTRYVPLDLWDANRTEVAATPDWFRPALLGKPCWAGLDLSSKLDLTAWSLLFEDGTVLWRLWCPESIIPKLDRDTDGRFGLWCNEGWITATEGDVIDYERIYDDIEQDYRDFVIRSASYDKWSGEPVRQAVTERTGLEMFESGTTYERMTQPMKELMRMLKSDELNHGGNPADPLAGRQPGSQDAARRPGTHPPGEARPQQVRQADRRHGLAAVRHRVVAPRNRGRRASTRPLRPVWRVTP